MKNMKKWNLVIDVAGCENCSNCALATKDEHIGNDFPGYAAPQPRHGHHWIRIENRVRGSAPMVDVAHVPTTCNHCDEAPCIAAAQGGEIYKRADGMPALDGRAGLLIPVMSHDGTIGGMILRPDNPALDPKGKPLGNDRVSGTHPDRVSGTHLGL